MSFHHHQLRLLDYYYSSYLKELEGLNLLLNFRGQRAKESLGNGEKEDCQHGGAHVDLLSNTARGVLGDVEFDLLLEPFIALLDPIVRGAHV